jgi:hypothetical protein
MVWFTPIMQVLPPSGIVQPPPTVAPPAIPLAGPAAPAAPIEPARRVTANRDGGRSDLVPQQQLQRLQPRSPTRGRLIDFQA